MRKSKTSTLGTRAAVRVSDSQRHFRILFEQVFLHFYQHQILSGDLTWSWKESFSNVENYPKMSFGYKFMLVWLGELSLYPVFQFSLRKNQDPRMSPIRVQLIIVSSCCQDKHNKIPSCFLPIEKHFHRFLVYSIFSKYWLLKPTGCRWKSTFAYRIIVSVSLKTRRLSTCRSDFSRNPRLICNFDDLNTQWIIHFRNTNGFTESGNAVFLFCRGRRNFHRRSSFQSSGVLLFGNRRLNNYGSRGVTSRKLHFYAGSVLMSTDTYPLEVDWFGVSTDKNPSHLTHNNV
jgi:hypothetical protein